MGLLVRTPEPYPTESFRGYILRISEANGYKSPYYIMKYAGYDNDELRFRNFTIEKLAAIIGKSLSDFFQLSTYRNRDHKTLEFQLPGHLLNGTNNSVYFNINSPSVCPYCVLEEQYLDVIWDLKIVVACPKHHCSVINQCSSCGKKLRWFRPGLLTCQCGKKISELPAKKVAQPIAELMSIVFSKFHGKPFPVANTSQFPLSELKLMSLGALIRLLQQLGKFNLFSQSLPIKSDKMSLVMNAANVLKNWPYEYYDFLRRLGKYYSEKGITTLGLRNHYRSFCHALFEQPEHAKDNNFFRNEFLKFGGMEWRKGVVFSKYLKTDEHQKRFISQAELARKMGVSPLIIQRLYKEGRVSLQSNVINGKTFFMVDTNLLNITPNQKGIIFTCAEAAKYIGIPINIFNLIKRKICCLTTNRSLHTKCFNKIDLDNFRNELIKLSNPIEDKCIPPDSFTFSHIIKKGCSLSKKEKTDFINHYLTQKIRSVGRKGNDVHDILFKKADVYNFIIDREFSTEKTVAIAKAATRLITSHYVVKGLIKKRYLVHYNVKNMMRISCKSIDSFKKRYISFKEIARNIGTSSERLKRLCTYSLIPFISVPTSCNYKSQFLQRKYLSKLMEKSKECPPNVKIKELAVVTSRSRFMPLLIQYFDKLKKNNAHIPKRGNKYNKAEIARGCGFSPSGLRYNIKDLNEYIKKLKTEIEL